MPLVAAPQGRSARAHTGRSARPFRPGRRLAPAIGALAAGALIVAAAVPSGAALPQDDATPVPTSQTPSPSKEARGGADAAGAFDPYAQEVSWSACPGSDFQCATIKVPLDWSAPTDGRTMEIAFAIAPARQPDQRLGSLLVNPGGPGGSGIESLSYLASGLPEGVRDRYDIIGFDPRGVGLSTPVECYDDEQMNEWVNWLPPNGETEGITESHDAADAFASACLARTGSALAYMDSGSTARDMDVIRAVLGDEKLNYVGYSYGTYIGSMYAEAFPATVGRMVLDGVVDPVLPSDEESITQLASFEKSLRTYVADCQGGSACPLTGSVDEGVAQLQQFLAERKDKPLSTMLGRPLTQAMAVTGVIVAMYSDEMWSALTMALTSAMGTSADGTVLLSLADAYYERDSATGAFNNNMFEAFTAISCLDKPTDAKRATTDAFNAAIVEASPTFGPYSLNGPIACAEWPYPARLQPHEITADGAAPIVVVGTTGDPATPYDNSVNLAKSLASGVLVTFEGEGHTALGQSACVGEAVQAYFVDGTVPQDGLTCAS